MWKWVGRLGIQLFGGVGGVSWWVGCEEEGVRDEGGFGERN